MYFLIAFKYNETKLYVLSFRFAIANEVSKSLCDKIMVAAGSAGHSMPNTDLNPGKKGRPDEFVKIGLFI